METPTSGRFCRIGCGILVAAFVLFAAGCSSSEGTAGSGGSNGGISLGGSSSANDPVSPDFALAYIKRTLPVANDPNAITLVDDVRVQRVWNGPADVWVRERASPSAKEVNITASITGGKWDVRDLDTSFDAKKLIFSMRPPLIPNANQRDQPKWAMYEYDVASATVRKVISDSISADLGHDVGPHYLPDGRIVFSSTRQRDARAVLIDEGKAQFSAGIEGNRDLPSFLLHVMNADGTGIRQISFHTGHDLDPSVLNDGRIVFTRWDIDATAGMHLYAVNPDGSNLQLLYGRNSHNTGTPGSLVHFTQARARPDGKVAALLLPFAGTDFGGDITLIDGTRFVENTQAILGAQVASSSTGQVRLVVNDVRTSAGASAGNGAPTIVPPSPGGRFASVFPLWDGTNRLVVTWTQCRLLDATLIVPCTDANLRKAGVVSAPPVYGIWIYDTRTNTQLPIVSPVEGVMVTNAVVLQPRLPTPQPIADDLPSATGSYTFSLAAEGVGILNIKSVYDFDGVDIAPGGIAAMRDPTRRPADPTFSRPRFLRIEKAVSLPDRDVLPNNAFPNYAFGAAAGFMREMIGYAPIEPDGSVRVKVPGNIPFQISILDGNGQRLDGTFPRHRNWMQIRVGETVTCNGCHVQAANGMQSNSHGRKGLFSLVNTGAAAGVSQFPNTSLQVTDRTGVLTPALGTPNAGETMAEYRARVQVTCVDASCAAQPAVDLVFTDVWAIPGVGVTDPPFTRTNAQLLTPAPVRADCATNWQANCRVVIHYPIHIAPLWTTQRTTITAVNPATTMPYTACTDCHSPKDAAGAKRVPGGQLDLSSSPSSSATCVQDEYTSFCQLLFPHDELDPVTMLPIIVLGPPDPVTGVQPKIVVQAPAPMSGAGAGASAVFFQKFTAGMAPVTCATGLPCPHTGWLRDAELKLVSEWLDIGAQYYNDPFAIPPPK